MFRKVLSLLLLLSVLVSSAAMAETTYPLVDEPIEVTFAVFTDAEIVEGERILWKAIADLTGIELDWTVIPIAQREVYYAMHEWPDMLATTVDAAEEYGAQAHWLVNFLDYLDYMPNLKKTLEDYPAILKTYIASDGGLYALPIIDKGPTSSNARLHYRYDKLEELGLAIPTTIDEFYEVCVALYNASGEAPLTDGFKPVHGYYNWAPVEGFFFASFGDSTIPNFDDDGTGKVVYNRTSDQYRRYLTFVNKLYTEGLLHKEYLTLDSNMVQARVVSGQAVFGNTGFNALTADGLANGFSDLRQLTPLTSEWRATPAAPACPVEKRGGAAINANSKYIIELCQMADIFYATEDVVEGSGLNGISSNYGVQNVTWRYTDETKKFWEQIIPADSPVQNDTTYLNNYVLNPHIVWGRKDGDFSSALSGPESNLRARQEGYVNNLIPYQDSMIFPANQMAFTETENATRTLYEAELYAYVDEWSALFISGLKNPNNDADWAEYIKGFEKVHLNELLEIYQAAYDRYLAL